MNGRIVESVTTALDTHTRTRCGHERAMLTAFIQSMLVVFLAPIQKREHCFCSVERGKQSRK